MQCLRHNMFRALSLVLTSLVGWGFPLSASTLVETDGAGVCTLGDLAGESGASHALAARQVTQIFQVSSRCNYVAYETYTVSTNLGLADVARLRDEQQHENHFVAFPKRSGVVWSGASSCARPESASGVGERVPCGNPDFAGSAREACGTTVGFRRGVDRVATKTLVAEAPVSGSSDSLNCVRLKSLSREKMREEQRCVRPLEVLSLVGTDPTEVGTGAARVVADPGAYGDPVDLAQLGRLLQHGCGDVEGQEGGSPTRGVLWNSWENSSAAASSAGAGEPLNSMSPTGSVQTGSSARLVRRRVPLRTNESLVQPLIAK